LKCAPELPSEEDHFETYKRIAEAAYPFKAVIRTLDLGGEKYFHEQLAPQEVNPVLGLRAIRFSLRHHQFFKTQLKGILRASTKKNLEIMFPMVTIVEELKTAISESNIKKIITDVNNLNSILELLNANIKEMSNCIQETNKNVEEINIEIKDQTEWIQMRLKFPFLI